MATGILPDCDHSGYLPPARSRTEPKLDLPKGRFPVPAHGQRADPPLGVVGTGDPTVDIPLLRYLLPLAQCVSTIVLQIQPSLIRLAQALDPQITVVPSGQCFGTSPQVPLPMLARIVAAGSGSDQAHTFPYLHVPLPAALACHQVVARIAKGRPKIGLFSCPEDGYDAAFQRLRAMPGIAWICQDTVAPSCNPGIPWLDFLDQAALLECLDLVATADMAIALLAEGLGKEVWWLGDPMLVKGHVSKVSSAFPSIRLAPLSGHQGLAAVGQAIRTWYNRYYDQLLFAVPCAGELDPPPPSVTTCIQPCG